MLEEPDDFNVLGSDVEDDETPSPVLFVPTKEKDEDLSAPPMDGYEFLKRVVEERKSYEAVVVKNVKTKPQKNAGKQILDFPEYKCCPEFCLDKETQLSVISKFSKLRMAYEARRARIQKEELKKLSKSMPKKKDEAGWLKVLTNKPPNLADSLELENSSVELCLAITQAKIAYVMEYIDDWVSEGELTIPLVCQWVYTLLAIYELPLDPDFCATLRRITRTLISRRAQLESLESEELPHINVVICIIGRYFNQLDLADPMD